MIRSKISVEQLVAERTIEKLENTTEPSKIQQYLTTLVLQHNRLSPDQRPCSTKSLTNELMKILNNFDYKRHHKRLNSIQKLLTLLEEGNKV